MFEDLYDVKLIWEFENTDDFLEFKPYVVSLPDENKGRWTNSKIHYTIYFFQS
jgi:hypothetical protein